MVIQIITNHVPRFVVYAWELTAKERAEFDYLDWEAIEAGKDSASFFRYRGSTYDLGDFMRTSDLGVANELKEWQGYISDSFFSGIVVKYVDDNGESVIVGRYFS